MNARHVAAAVLVAVAVSVSGCAAPPEPAEPTPTFATEEEAFAAAEETYRAYVDAVNARRAGDSDPPSPESFLTGTALQDEITFARQLREQGRSIRGDNIVSEVKMLRAENNLTGVLLWACIDLSETVVVDAAGANTTPADRVNRTAVEVSLDLVGGHFLISTAAAAEVLPC
ncbi:hypothetical protein ACFXP7_11665 [Microbacterium sp. P06]|uniref:hypothetical protein n=1 Tax=Microbacterium sp. P06 TaxID=3366949 RepID=UPI003745C6E7